MARKVSECHLDAQFGRPALARDSVAEALEAPLRVRLVQRVVSYKDDGNPIVNTIYILVRIDACYEYYLACSGRTARPRRSPCIGTARRTPRSACRPGCRGTASTEMCECGWKGCSTEGMRKPLKSPTRMAGPTYLWVVVEPLSTLCAFGPGVPLLAHAVARLVALLPLTAVRVAAWP